jgi:hypothetical protein
LIFFRFVAAVAVVAVVAVVNKCDWVYYSMEIIGKMKMEKKKKRV